jgi:hypothetical protein
MVHQCEQCGKYWGGLVTDGSLPTPNDCPWCGASETEHLEAVLQRTAKDVAHIIETERAGEHVTAGTMEMRLH